MPKTSYMGNGSSTEFSFNFPYYENTDIIVTKNNETVTNYTIIGTSGGENADIPYIGGKVVFDVAPTALDSIIIKRQIPLTRIIDYQPTEKINPTLLNQDMNYDIEVLKDMYTELDDFHSKYARIINKDETNTLLARIEEIDNEITDSNQTINDLNQKITNGQIMSKDAFFSYTANCITEIPQDINLELNNGTLTLKAGSKVYVPNGAGVFDVRNITSDATLTDASGANNVWLIAVSVNGTLLYRALANCTSGANATASSGFAYDTTANDIGWFTSGGTKSYSNVSFPICICSSSSSGFTSIDQVFNGFGYIGSTVFALPGVKGLAPDGRNADGTLKSIVIAINSVITRTFNATGALYIDLQATSFGEITKSNYSYDPNANVQYSSGTAFSNSIVFASCDMSSGVISNWTVLKNNPFHAVDYSDTEFIAHQAMPSERRSYLTLPASGGTLTMPADGYLSISKMSDSTGQYLVLNNSTKALRVSAYPVSGAYANAVLPVSKGDVATIQYNLGGTTAYCAFVYANGAK